jgi:glutaconate CoA-transferase subunit A
MAESPFVDLDDLVGRVPDGCRLAVPKDGVGTAAEAVRALIRRGATDLHLLCLPVGGYVADLLIGAGCVSTIECSGVSLGEFGFAPRFRTAVESGGVRILDATCQAIYAAVQASEKGAPFAPIRGLIGTDILRFRDDWKIIQNPVAEGDDPVVVVPAIKPDMALFHARLGDRLGNVWVGNARECVHLAHAASDSIATVEEIHDGNLMADERYLSGTIPPIYVGAVAHAPGGALPVYSPDTGTLDREHMMAYAAAARTEDGFRDYLERHVLGARHAA